MKIEIAEKWMPFSHLPGVACVIPCTNWEIEAYPTLLKIGKKKIELKLDLQGPVRAFTLQQDLEKNCVWVFGEAKEGHFCLKVEASDSGIDLTADRVPAKGIQYNGTLHGILKRKETLHFPAEISYVSKSSFEKLSLGSHKSQDWDLVKKRGDLKEMAPILFALGQRVPYVPPQPLKGTARLLELPEDKTLIAPVLEALFKAAFTKLLIPRLIDDEHQGLVPEEPAEGNRFYLLQQGAKAIRNLFFQQNERRLQWLPLLPPSFDCGRMVGVEAEGIGSIDFEWTKKRISRVLIRADTNGDAVMVWPKDVKRYRLRENMRQKGERVASNEPLRLQAGKTYYLDRFEK